MPFILRGSPWQLTAHFDSMTDSMSEQFNSPIGKTSTQDLLSWEQELEACVNRIDGERPLYSVVARQLNEVLNDRTLTYIIDTKQGQSFRLWEEERQKKAGR